MTQTTYNSLQAGDILVERDNASGNVTLTSIKGNFGMTIAASDFDAIVSGFPALKTPPVAGR